MLINIAIIENEEYHTDILLNLLKNWSKAENCILETHLFQSGEAFFATNNSTFDMIFIDIQLSGMDGMDIAKQLRNTHYNGHIIFTTSYSDYVFDAYNIHAFNYLLKPITEDKLYPCLNSILGILNVEYYIYRTRDTIQKIPCNDILYFSSAKHHTQIVTSSDSISHLVKMKDVILHLPSQFHQCHRTSIININHILKLEGYEVTMSNQDILTISKPYIDEIRKAFSNLIL